MSSHPCGCFKLLYSIIMESPEYQWRTFLHQCLIRRIDVPEFKDISDLLMKRCPVSESTLASLLLESRSGTYMKWDPLLPLFIDCLLRTGKLNTSTVLGLLLKQSSIVDEKQKRWSKSPSQDVSSETIAKEKEKEKENEKDKKMKKKTEISINGRCSLMTDIKIIQDVMLSISLGHIPVTTTDAGGIFTVVSDWILTVVAWYNSNSDEYQHVGGLMSSPDVISLFELLGVVLAVLSGSAKGMEFLSTTINNEGRTRPLPQLPVSRILLTRGTMQALKRNWARRYQLIYPFVLACLYLSITDWKVYRRNFISTGISESWKNP